MVDGSFPQVKRRKLNKISKNILLLLLIVLLAAIGFFYYRYQKIDNNPTKEQIEDQEETKKLLSSVGELILLPKDETPTIATITDINKLKDELFFKDASNGNKVLIYSTSKRAIIYDQNAHLIINVGPINYSQSNQPIRIALRNGTSTVGLTHTVEADIKKVYPEAEIVSKDQSGRTDYEKTMIVVLDDASINIAESISKALNIEISNLPEGESQPSGTNLLIIVGKDKKQMI